LFVFLSNKSQVIRDLHRDDRMITNISLKLVFIIVTPREI